MKNKKELKVKIITADLGDLKHDRITKREITVIMSISFMLINFKLLIRSLKSIQNLLKIRT